MYCWVIDMVNFGMQMLCYVLCFGVVVVVDCSGKIIFVVVGYCQCFFFVMNVNNCFYWIEGFFMLQLYFVGYVVQQGWVYMGIVGFIIGQQVSVFC